MIPDYIDKKNLTHSPLKTMSRRQIDLLKKLKGGIIYDPVLKTITNDVSMSDEELKELIATLKKQRNAIKNNLKNPKIVDRETNKLIRNCEAAGLKEMPDHNGIVGELLRKVPPTTSSRRCTMILVERRWSSVTKVPPGHPPLLQNKDVLRRLAMPWERHRQTREHDRHARGEHGHGQAVRHWSSSVGRCARSASLRRMEGRSARSREPMESHNINPARHRTPASRAAADSVYGEPGESCL